MSKGTAKIKKAASQVGAVLSGKLGVLNTLEGEHSEITSMMNDLSKADSAERKRKLYHEIHENLLIHMRGEEQGVYPELKLHESTRTMTEQAIREHTEIKQLFSTLDDLTVGTPQWQQSFASLQRAVEAHVEFEEHQLFDKAKHVLSGETLRKLDDSYRAYRKHVEEQGETFEPKLASGGR